MILLIGFTAYWIIGIAALTLMAIFWDLTVWDLGDLLLKWMLWWVVVLIGLWLLARGDIGHKRRRA